MTIVYILIGIIIAVVLIIKVLDKGESNLNQVTYSKKKILTEAEQKFFLELRTIVDDKCIIFPQIQLSKILSFEAVGKNRIRALNRLNQKSVDYVLVDKYTFETKLVIELDDYTHNFKNRKSRDEYVNQLMEMASINFIRTDLGNLNKIREYLVHN